MTVEGLAFWQVRGTIKTNERGKGFHGRLFRNSYRMLDIIVIVRVHEIQLDRRGRQKSSRVLPVAAASRLKSDAVRKQLMMGDDDH